MTNDFINHLKWSNDQLALRIIANLKSGKLIWKDLQMANFMAFSCEYILYKNFSIKLMDKENPIRLSFTTSEEEELITIESMLNYFRQNFDNWTSGNKDIDKFIHDNRHTKCGKSNALEWIPYDRFYNIQYIEKIGVYRVGIGKDSIKIVSIENR
ncbi:hypothetical protein RhiirB3_452513 [Rhizophagus irregularis]|nr:hypothetical protein RhiirB3_452513 [Rhizophagus irregularis]